jgi:hypothetical protein
MRTPERRRAGWILGGHTAAVVLTSGVLIFGLASCGADNQSSPPSGGDHLMGPSDDAPTTLLGSIPRSRTDSILAVRQVARSLARGLADDQLRADFVRAFRRSRVAEGKLQIQRFLKRNGEPLARRVEQLNGLPAGDLDRALASVEDLELYLPNPVDRQSWEVTSDVLVTGFVETDTELRGRGTVTAYDTGGREVAISYTEPSSRPVIVLTNVETQYDTDGESSPWLATGSQPKHPYISFMQCQDCAPPPPLNPPDPCENSSTATNVYICRAYIRDVDHYEGFLRGSPEVAMLMFSEFASGTGMAQIGCINEDQSGSRYYNQDNDNWTGKALIGNKDPIDQAHAAGKGVLMLVWEDDQGSKCSFQTSSSTKRAIFRFLDIAGAAVSLGWATCAATDQCSSGPPPWLFFTGFSVAAISEIILGNDDDLIGAVALPPGVDPYATPAPILYRESSTSGIQSRGTVTFVAKP